MDRVRCVVTDDEEAVDLRCCFCRPSEFCDVCGTDEDWQLHNAEQREDR